MFEDPEARGNVNVACSRNWKQTSEIKAKEGGGEEQDTATEALLLRGGGPLYPGGCGHLFLKTEYLNPRFY
jgi:hypothetical protein